MSDATGERRDVDAEGMNCEEGYVVVAKGLVEVVWMDLAGSMRGML